MHSALRIQMLFPTLHDVEENCCLTVVGFVSCSEESCQIQEENVVKFIGLLQNWRLCGTREMGSGEIWTSWIRASHQEVAKFGATH